MNFRRSKNLLLKYFDHSYSLTIIILIAIMVMMTKIKQLQDQLLVYFDKIITICKIHFPDKTNPFLEQGSSIITIAIGYFWKSWCIN